MSPQTPFAPPAAYGDPPRVPRAPVGLERRDYGVPLPSAQGLPGLLGVLGGVLRLSLVQTLTIAPQGVTWTRFVPHDEPHRPPEEDDTAPPRGSLTPSAALRTLPGRIVALPEVPTPEAAWFRALRAADALGLVPCGVAHAPLGRLAEWLGVYAASTPVAGVEYFLGVPLLRDPHLPDDAAFVFAATAPGLSFYEATHAIRIPIPPAAFVSQPLAVESPR